MKPVKLRERLFELVSVGVVNDRANQIYDITSTSMLIINLVVSFMLTFDDMAAGHGALLRGLEAVTVLFFAVDYALRLITAKYLYTELSEPRALIKYIFSFSGIIDILSFLPYYLPVFIPAGAATFRMFRVARIFRLFRINAHYDSLNVITEVISSKKQQLLSSVYILMVLVLASSLGMYSLEHEAQPEVFTNAFSGIWWAVSTLATVGYGDIYPVTPLGRILGICITFLGVGVVAVPTGIISAGFVEQYTRLKRLGDIAEETDIKFIKIRLNNNDSWCNKAISELELPAGMIVAAVIRDENNLIPRGDLVLKVTDTVIIGADALKDDTDINLKEIILKRNHPWNGKEIRKLDISRHSFIILVKRNGQTLIPRGDLKLECGDVVFVYSTGESTILDRIEF